MTGRRALLVVVGGLLLLLSSCADSSDSFRIKGRFRNFNQGEFYIYCVDGVPRMDTIHVMDGRFAYETLITQPTTFVLRFPNNSEQAVFADQGAKVNIEGDASHLKEIEIKGTDDNKTLTDWRLHVANLTPPEVKAEAVSFIKEHLDSRISNYLLTRYLVLSDDPDYKTASQLVALMLKQQPDNGQLIALEQRLRGVRNIAVGSQLPAFTATATDGRKVSRQTMNADLNIISTWAQWNQQSMAMQRKLRQQQKHYGARISLLSINLDAWPDGIKKQLERDSITWPQVADGQLWQTPLVAQLGFSSVMGNIIFDRNGRVLALNVPVDQLDQRLRELLK